MTSEFRLRYSSPGGAFLSLALVLFSFILLPLSLFALLNGVAGNMGTEGLFDMSPEQIQIILDKIWEYIRRLIRYSIPLLLIAIPLGLYRPGSYARIPFKFLFAIYSVIIIIGFTDGGIIELALSDMPIELGEIPLDDIAITLDITVFIYITILIGTAGAFLAFTEFASNRKDFVEKRIEIDEKRSVNKPVAEPGT